MCDTFIALPPSTAQGCVVFGKNSDRPVGEGQRPRIYPAARHEGSETLHCTYIDIPQTAATHRILLSQIDWMWGGEMGANEHGVVIGNEAVWTRIEQGPPALLGMDLVRLGLERGSTARQALDVMTALLEEFGQGGGCAENDPGFTYDNSFLIADFNEAWVLETAGRFWVAERVGEGYRNISNRLSIGSRYDLCSKGLVDHARSQGLLHDGDRVDFSSAFSTAPLEPEPGSRESWGSQLLTQSAGRISPETMKELLRHHDSGICMHGGFETTASMVSRLGPNGEMAHWMTDGPNPCAARFERIDAFAASTLLPHSS